MSLNKKKSILIALVHNNNEKRNKIIIPNIDLLKKFLSKKYDVSTKKFSFQIKVKPYSLFLTFIRDLLFFIYEHKWCNYRLIKPHSIYGYLKHIRYMIIDYLKNKDDFRMRKKKTFAIETILSDKHIRVLDYFLESYFDYLIVLEDDATFKDNTNYLIEKVLEILSNEKIKDLFYVDLAGGPKVSELQISNIINEKRGDIIFLNRPITNTTCSFMMNAKLAKELKSVLLKNPLYRFIPADHMFNALFFKINYQSKALCLHLEPTALSHGSMYEGSTIR